MLPDKIQLQIVTPEREVASEAVDEVILPGIEGSFGVRPGHAPLLAGLDIGQLAFRLGGKTRLLAMSGGYAEVLRDRVQVLAETCEFAEEIDVERAERARKRALERLEASDADARRAEASLRRAMSRLQVRRVLG